MFTRSTLVAVATLVLFSTSVFADDNKKAAGLDPFAEVAPGARIVLSEDPVVASFQRMLTHEANWTAPSVPASFEKDPLIEALALPTLRWSATTAQRTVQCD